MNERRHRNPLVPLSIFRIKGLAAADATQVIAMAGFYSAFFFLTLYMQNVLGFSAVRAGAAYVPVAAMVAVSAGVGTALITRIGTRPLIVAGALIAAGGVYWLSRIPAHGFYVTDLLPGLLIMALGLGGVFVGVQTAANAGVPPRLAGLAAALINASIAGRRRARAGDLLGDRHLPHPASAGRARAARERSPAGSIARCWLAASSWSPRR